MESPARVPFEPNQELRTLVAAILAKDARAELAGRYGGLDRVQEAARMLGDGGAPCSGR